MPETYGLPEPEPERAERARAITFEVIAGQHVVRTTVLYVLLGVALFIVPAAAVVPLILLMATDPRLG